MTLGKEKHLFLVSLFFLFCSAYGTVLSTESQYKQDKTLHGDASELQTSRSYGWFLETFDGKMDDFEKHWEFAGYWANGQVCICASILTVL